MITNTNKYIGAAMLAVMVACPSALADDHYTNPQEAILKAASHSQAALQKELHSGVDVNATNDDRDTALMEAAESGNMAAVRNLIASGANVSAVDDDGETALNKAIDGGYNAVADAIRQAGGM